MVGGEAQDDVAQLVAYGEPLPFRAVLAIDANILFPARMREVITGLVVVKSRINLEDGAGALNVSFDGGGNGRWVHHPDQLAGFHHHVKLFHRYSSIDRNRRTRSINFA